MKSHGVGEAGGKQAVVDGGELLQDVRQAALLGGLEFQEAAQVSAGEHQGLERPDCPEGHQDDKFFVLADDALVLLQLDFQGVTEQAGVVQAAIRALIGHFGRGFVGNVFCGPDLAVGMGIAGAHHGPAVLEDLHMTNFRAATKFFELCRPGFHDAHNVRHLHAGQGQAVVGMEAQHAADAALRFRSE